MHLCLAPPSGDDGEQPTVAFEEQNRLLKLLTFEGIKLVKYEKTLDISFVPLRLSFLGYCRNVEENRCNVKVNYVFLSQESAAEVIRLCKKQFVCVYAYCDCDSQKVKAVVCFK